MTDRCHDVDDEWLIRLHPSGADIFRIHWTSTTLDLDITVDSKNSFTVGFWIDSGISTMMRGWHHCRFLKINTDHQATVSVSSSTQQCPVEQHCRSVVLTDSDGCFKSVGSWLKPEVLSKPTMSVHVSNRQCCHNHHCRFMVQAGSVD